MSLIGLEVDYWKGARRGVPSGRGIVKAEGEVGGTQVVWIVGVSGCLAVSHVEVVRGHGRA